MDLGELLFSRSLSLIRDAHLHDFHAAAESLYQHSRRRLLPPARVVRQQSALPVSPMEPLLLSPRRTPRRTPSPVPSRRPLPPPVSPAPPPMAVPRRAAGGVSPRRPPSAALCTPRAMIASHRHSFSANGRTPTRAAANGHAADARSGASTPMRWSNENSPGYLPRTAASSLNSGQRTSRTPSPTRFDASHRSTLTGVFDWPYGASTGVVTRRSASVRPDRPLRIQTIQLDSDSVNMTPKSYVSNHFSSCSVNALLECTATKASAYLVGSEERLLPGDILVSCNGAPLTDITHLLSLVQETLDRRESYVMLGAMRGLELVVVREVLLP